MRGAMWLRRGAAGSWLAAVVGAQTLSATATSAGMTLSASAFPTQSIPAGQAITSGAHLSVGSGIVTGSLDTTLVVGSTGVQFTIDETLSYLGTSSSTAATVLTVTASAPTQAVVVARWTHSPASAVNNGAGAVDIGNDGTDELYDFSVWGSRTNVLPVSIGVQPLAIGIRSAASVVPGTASQAASRLEISVLPVRCNATTYLPMNCPSEFNLTAYDSLPGVVRFEPTDIRAIGELTALVVGVQQQALWMPPLANCGLLAVVPTASLLAVTNGAPYAFQLDLRSVPGPFAFFAQTLTLHTSTTIVNGSNGLQISCQ